jgi:hypothetical protein
LLEVGHYLAGALGRAEGCDDEFNWTIRHVFFLSI